MNFLFDKDNEHFLEADTICDHFETKKSTIGSRATQIEKMCKLGLGAKGFCSPDITDSFTFYQTPEGVIIPKKLLLDDREIVYEILEGEEAEELKRVIEEKQKEQERIASEKRERRKEINQRIAQDRRRKKEEEDRRLQPGLFDDS